jgi:response regulator RpfG family c-di-GMP phosphodiesterase
MKKSSDGVAEKLLSSGVITKEKYEETANRLKSQGGFIEELLIESGAVDEETLLKSLANIYRTQYVSTEKLRHADISPKVLKMIPHKVAAKYTIFPILFDTKKQELAIVNYDVSNLEVEQAAAQASNIPRIRSYIARPAAIKAAINKHYRGDIHAFAHVGRNESPTFQNLMDNYQRNVLDEEAMTVSLASESQGRDRMISVREMEDGAKQVRTDGSSRSSVDMENVLEMVRVMVSLIESNREELAGHSAQTAHFTDTLCRRIGLADSETASIVMGALIHDLGKGSPYHLTPFNVAEWDGHRIAAQKRYENPERLVRTVNLSQTTIHAIRYMYERFDGQGIPDGKKGKEIPLGARIIAMADTYTDLISNPRNPFRRTLSTEEAMQCLKKAKGKVFDPNLVDLFGMTVAGDDIKRQLLTGAQTVLLVDSDPEQCAILDLQLTSKGFKVRTARTAEVALNLVKEVVPSIIIAEIDWEPFDGFELKERLNKGEKEAEIPVIFFTNRTSSADVEKGFSLGAQDYLVKPSTADVVAAKISKYLAETPNQTTGGVSGSLKEMSLPDLVQILSHGRKSGQLKLTMGAHRGEIHFVSGEIHNALFDTQRGQEAFFQMLRFKDGNFVLNPDFKASSREIEMTAEMLLLEGMRVLDEDSK